MKLSADLAALSDRIGYTFKSTDLLVEAMTHASLSSNTRSDNQRMEFLGDRVLGLTIAEALLNDDPAAAEGTLAPRLNALVRKETCAEVAIEVDLGAALKMGRSEMLSGGRRKQAILGDAMEALIAAVYRDSDFITARDFILRLWGTRLVTVDDVARDPKTALQEWAQARKMPPPIYTVMGRTGPDHAPEFEIEASLQNGAKAVAKATSKRQAQQLAATLLLAELENQND